VQAAYRAAIVRPHPDKGGSNEHAAIINAAYWQPKIDRNRLRDQEVRKMLKRRDWRVFRVW
jgi:G:T-mismatch repair DNA endonuclease (very short patch repair protein)